MLRDDPPLSRPFEPAPPPRAGEKRFRHGPGYWITAAVILAVSTWLSPTIETFFNFDGARNWLFERLAQDVTNPAAARDVKLVFIKDDAYWKGPLHHRSPTDRTYLARIVRALDAADAGIIALDFDLRLADPDVDIQPGDYAKVDAYKPYRDETDQLVRAIDEVAQRRKIVLVKTFGYGDDGYQFEGDAYQAYGICNKLNRNGTWQNPGTPEFPLSPAAARNIYCGYIALMPDKRRVPPPIEISGEPGKLDSFPFAVARARNTIFAPSLQDKEYYGTYITENVMDNPRIAVSATTLLGDPAKVRRMLQGEPVIVGAAWHLHAVGRGAMVDIHDTPIGPVNGTLIHENMAEALMNDRIYPALSAPYLQWIEVAAGIVAALVFAMASVLWTRLATIAFVVAVLFAAQWLTLQLFGTFVDAFVPVFALGIHAVVGLMTEPE